jgi:hypothetical protein
MKSFSDAQAFEQLKKSGADLTQVHRIEFHLRFKSEAEVAKAIASLEALAFDTRSEPIAGTGKTWLVRATKMMYPVETDIEALSTKLERIAAEDSGTYEGWHATPRD